MTAVGELIIRTGGTGGSGGGPNHLSSYPPYPPLYDPAMEGPPSVAAQGAQCGQQQIGGNHYKKLKIQPWDYIIDNKLDYFQGSIVKYITRWRDKGGIEDLLKAKHFLDRYIEKEKQDELVSRNRQHT